MNQRRIKIVFHTAYSAFKKNIISLADEQISS